MSGYAREVQHERWLERIGNAVACVGALTAASYGIDWWALDRGGRERRIESLRLHLSVLHDEVNR